MVKVVEVPRHTYTGSIKEATQQAIEATKSKYAPNGEAITLHYANHGVEFDYSISGNAMEVVLSPKHQAKSANKGVHLSLAEHIDKIINESIEVKEHPDYVKNDDGERDTNIINDKALMHRFYGAVTIDGMPYRVMILMREEKRSNGMRNGIHAYEITKVELLNDDTPSSSSGGHGIDASITSVAVATVIKDVGKTMDSGKKLLKESKKADEEFGEEGAIYRDGETEDRGV